MKIRINQKKVLLFLLLLPFFAPDGMTTVGTEGYILNASFLNNEIILLSVTYIYRLRNLIGLVIIMLVLIKQLNRGLKITKKIYQQLPLVIMFAMYVIWTAMSTMINGGNIYDIFVVLIYCVGYLLLIERAIEDNPKYFIDVLCFITQMLLFINFILLCYFPNGITKGTDYLSTAYYFLGTKNQISPFLILSVMVLLLQNEIKKKNVVLILGTLLIVANTVWMSSSTSIISVFLMLSIIFSRRIINNRGLVWKIKSKRSHTFNGGVLIGITVIVSIGIVFFRFQNAFKWLIVDILNKDISISGRTETWLLAIMQIKNRWLIGYGYGHMITSHYYAHNAILELLVTTGIIGTALYICMIYKAVWNLIRKDRMWNEIYKIIIIAALVAILIVNTGEAFLYNISQLTIYIFVYYARDLKRFSLNK